MADFVIRLVDDGSTPQTAPATSAPGSPGTPSGAGGGFGGSPADSNVSSFMSEAVKSVADRAGLGDAVNAFSQIQGIGDQLGGLLKAGGSPVGASSEVVMAELAGGAAAGGGSAGAGGAASAGGGALAAVASNPYTIAAAAVAAVAVGGAVIVNEYAKLMGAEAERLKDASPEISMAMAQADFREEMSKMRRADQIGPQLAEFTDFQSRTQERLADIQTEILTALLDLFEALQPLLETGLSGLDVIVAETKAVNATMQTGARLVRGDLEGARESNERAVESRNRLLESIAELLGGGKDREPDVDPWLANFLNKPPEGVHAPGGIFPPGGP